MLNFKQNEDAVSPVIGVILMVAITVILAAVIAAFVFGMTGNVQNNKNIAVTATQNGPNVLVTYQGGADANSLVYLKTTFESETAKYTGVGTNDEVTTPADGKTTGIIMKKILPVGTVITAATSATGEREHIIVVAHFTDGTDQVVLDTYV